MNLELSYEVVSKYEALVASNRAEVNSAKMEIQSFEDNKEEVIKSRDI